MCASCVNKDMFNPLNHVMLLRYYQSSLVRLLCGLSKEYSACHLLTILLVYFLAANKQSYYFLCLFKT